MSGVVGVPDPLPLGAIDATVFGVETAAICATITSITGQVGSSLCSLASLAFRTETEWIPLIWSICD